MKWHEANVLNFCILGEGFYKKCLRKSLAWGNTIARSYILFHLIFGIRKYPSRKSKEVEIIAKKLEDAKQLTNFRFCFTVSSLFKNSPKLFDRNANT